YQSIFLLIQGCGYEFRALRQRFLLLIEYSFASLSDKGLNSLRLREHTFQGFPGGILNDISWNPMRPSAVTRTTIIKVNGGIYFTPPNAIGCGLTRVANGAGSTCTACWARR